MIKIFIPGNPKAKGRAKARIVTPRGGKQFVQMYTPKDTVEYEKVIAIYGRQGMRGKKPTLQPVCLEIELFFEIPDSWPNWKKLAANEGSIGHTSKPDSDNVLKAIKDALNKIVWHDDAQVINTNIKKGYARNGYPSGALVCIQEYETLRPCQISKKSDLILGDDLLAAEGV